MAGQKTSTPDSSIRDRRLPPKLVVNSRVGPPITKRQNSCQSEFCNGDDFRSFVTGHDFQSCRKCLTEPRASAPEGCSSKLILYGPVPAPAITRRDGWERLRSRASGQHFDEEMNSLNICATLKGPAESCGLPCLNRRVARISGKQTHNRDWVAQVCIFRPGIARTHPTHGLHP